MVETTLLTQPVADTATVVSTSAFLLYIFVHNATYLYPSKPIVHLTKHFRLLTSNAVS